MDTYEEIKAGAGTYVTGKIRLVTANGDEITEDMADAIKVSGAILTKVRHPFAKGSLTADGVQYCPAVGLGTTDTVIEAAEVKQPAGYVLEQVELGLTGWLSDTAAAESIILKFQASDDNSVWQNLHDEVTKGESLAAGDVSCSGRFAPTGNFLGTGASIYLRMVARTAAAAKTGATKNSSYVEVRYRRA